MICIPHKYFSGDQIKKNEMSWACGTYRRQERCMQVLVGKPEGKRQFGRRRHRRKDDIKIDI